MEENTTYNAGVGNVKAIKTFFEEGKNGRKVTMDEMKALSTNDRAELGAMCIKALGW